MSHRPASNETEKVQLSLDNPTPRSRTGWTIENNSVASKSARRRPNGNGQTDRATVAYIYDLVTLLVLWVVK